MYNAVIDLVKLHVEINGYGAWHSLPKSFSWLKLHFSSDRRLKVVETAVPTRVNTTEGSLQNLKSVSMCNNQH
jgi:hypothetical protein